MRPVNLLLAVALLLPTAAWAAAGSPAAPRVLQIRSGAAASGDGSATAPFGSIPAALAVAQPGDTVQVAPGVYPEQWSTVRAGRAEAPITILGEGAQIRGPGPEGGRQVQILHSYITLRGFDISNADKLVWVQQATGVRILGNLLHDGGGECVRVKYLARANEIAHNTIARCGLSGFDLAADAKNGEGVYVGTAPEQLSMNPTPVVDASDGNWVHHNTIATEAAECVDVKEGTSRTLIEDNVCSGTRDPDSAGLDARGSGNIFRRNSSTGNAGGGVRLGGDSSGDGLDNVVEGNTLSDNAGYGLKIMRTPQASICGNIVERNAEGASSESDYDPSAACVSGVTPGAPAGPVVTAPEPESEEPESEEAESEEPESEEPESEESESEESESEESEGATSPAIAAATLVASAHSDRSAPQALDGTTVSGRLHVFLAIPDGDGIQEVTFWVDGEQQRSEEEWPYYMRGADDDEAALPWDTTTLASGRHTVTALVDHDDGYRLVQATVLVACSNPECVGSPPPTGGRPTHSGSGGPALIGVS